MKRFSFFFLFSLGLFVFTALRAQSVNSAEFGSTVTVWSGHTTVRERVDAGVNERIELWNRTWIVSPSGQVHRNIDHWGLNAPDGDSATTITFNQTGRWTYWASDAGSIDSWVYGDGPYAWYMWPHNPPNGLGYGGSGRRITAYIDVQPAAPINVAPTISWNSAPGTVASGQSYTVSAHGHDGDGNLAQVNVWKNGAPFAFAGGGNGTDGDSGNPTSDTGPATITFTAQAVDSNGATSSMITQTVTVSAPNNAPTAAISGSTALKINETGSWNFSGADVDGNLSQWRFYASTNGNPQWSSISGSFVSGSYSTSFSTPGSYTWKVDVRDSADAIGSASITVNVTAPPSVTASITASPTSSTAPESATISWSTSNATSVSVSGNGVSSSATSGSRSVSGLPAGTYTYTIVAQGANGPATQTATLTVTAAPNNAPTAAISGSTALETNETGSWNFSGADADGNLSQWRFYASTNGNPQWSSISGSFVSGSYSTSFSTPGSYTWKVEVQDSAGASRTASITVIVTAPPPVSASIAASPISSTAPGSTTISWSTSNATSVSVGGNGVSSSATSGSRTVSGLPAGTYTYTIVAQGANGPVTKTATLTVTAPPSVTGSISASPTTATAPGSVTIAWSTANATSVSVSGNGVSSSATNGSRTVSGLPAGTYTFTLSAQGYGGPVVRTAQVTVNPAPTFTLTTAATGGGNVTPGGTYSAGSVVTVAAAPDAFHRFTGWSGDASGTASTTAVTLDRTKFVQANFAAKTAQTITFDPPGDHPLTSPPFTLSASATSGLPVSFSLVSGPAILTGSFVQVTGAGPVTIQANQPGDAFFLPAASVNRSFNVTAAAILKYRGQSRTLLRGETSREAPPFVLEKP